MSYQREVNNKAGIGLALQKEASQERIFMKTIGTQTKNVSKYFTITSLLLALTVTILTSNYATANGRGYGGADYTTQSIPVELDKALVIKDVEKVETNCLNQYAILVISQMCQKLGGKMYDLDCVIDSDYAASPFNPSDSTGGLKYSIYIKNGTMLNAQKSHISISPEDIIKTGSYDDFGIYRPDSNRIKKIKINHVPNNYFKNRETGQPTNFLLQSDRIGECIETGIQKLVDKQ